MKSHHVLPLRTLADDADPHAGDSVAEQGGRLEEIADALARIHARDAQNGGAGTREGRRGGKERRPSIELDGLWHPTPYSRRTTSAE